MSNVIACLFSSAGADRAAVGLLGAGRNLANQVGGKLIALALGPANDALQAMAVKVADAVVVADQPELASYQPEIYLDALTRLCRDRQPFAVLLGNDAHSQELAPRLAHRLGGSAVGDGAELTVVNGALRVRRSVYGGKAMAVIELQRSPAVVWARARTFEPAPAQSAPGPVESARVDLQAPNRAKIVEHRAHKSEGVRLEDAEIIVSGGRGLGGPEPFETLKKLADALGAQQAASRAACDAGWVPPTWQVGQTGKKVAPSLYLAIAISGASQHIIGIADSKNIAAINTDPDAPIFKHCQFGLVEDYRKVVEPLAKRLSELLER